MHHLVVAALGGQPEPFLVRDVDAREHVLAERVAQRRADGGVHLVGACRALGRARERVVEPVGVEIHVLEIDAFAGDFTDSSPFVPPKTRAGRPKAPHRIADFELEAQSPQSKSWHCC